MQAIDRLLEEHRNILRALDVLDRIADEVAERPTEVVDEAKTIVAFLRGFADELHHGKEEVMLFPALGEAGLPVHGGPIAVMLTEHDEGRGHVRVMLEALDDLARYKDRFETAALEFTDVLRRHIEKENGVLFPMAEQVLSAGVLQQLTERFGYHDDVEHADAYRTHLRELESLEKRLAGRA